ncbi:MAG: Cell division protein FtsL [Myxococcales bacterium]|nr:Cell division protein FtsL [Myxococcales bacterium]
MQPVVEGNGFGKKRGIGVGGFLLALVTAGALTHVAVRMKGIEVAYDLGRERRISTELEEQRRRLQIEIGMLKDPGRVVTLARDKLKMAPPAAGDIIRAAPGALPAAAAVTAAAAAANDKAAATKNRPAAKPPAKTPLSLGAQAAAPAVRAAPIPARDESAEAE